MTTPVDPSPYAGPTDLVTAADVLAWLEEHVKEYDEDAIAPPREVLVTAYYTLTARLDRERRQACRWGALAHFRDACVHRQNERALFPMLEPEWAATAGECRRESIRRALAFRAAARQP